MLTKLNNQKPYLDEDLLSQLKQKEEGTKPEEQEPTIEQKLIVSLTQLLFDEDNWSLKNNLYLKDDVPEFERCTLIKCKIEGKNDGR